MMKSILIALGGMFFATAFIFSCSDDSPSDADAAACDCPEAEPPVPPRIVKVRGINSTVTGSAVAAGAACGSGAKLLSGGCFQVSNGSSAKLGLREFGAAREVAEAWDCFWDNNTPAVTDAVVYAEALCLMPP